MNKIREYAWEVVIGVLALGLLGAGYSWWSGVGVIAGLEDKREETKELVDQLHEQNEVHARGT